MGVMGIVYFEYVLNLLLHQPIRAMDAALLLGGLQLARHDVHKWMALRLVEDGTVGRLMVWVMREETAGAAVQLLCSLVTVEPHNIWQMAMQAEPAMLSRLCALTEDGAARKSAFHLLRVLCQQDLIELDTANQNHLREAVHAVPPTLAAAAAAVAGAQRWVGGRPEQSEADFLALSCFHFLGRVRTENPGLIDGDAALVRAVAASASAHTVPGVTNWAYDFLDAALQVSPELVHEVEAALPGLRRDVAHYPFGDNKACGMLMRIMMLPGGPRLLARNPCGGGSSRLRPVRRETAYRPRDHAVGHRPVVRPAPVGPGPGFEGDHGQV